MEEQVREQALTMVLGIIAVSALAIGLISVLFGRAVALWDSFLARRSVRHFKSVMLSVPPPSIADQQTDEPDRRADAALSGDPRESRRLALDRTRRAVLEELLTHGWTVTDLRREGILRGDNTAISQEVAEARKQLGMAPPEEYRTPIAGRATNPALYQDDPELAYQPPPR